MPRLRKEVTGAPRHYYEGHGSAMLGQHFTNVDGLRVRYFEAGAGRPVVLLHGGSTDSALVTWREVIPILAQHFRVVVPDLPGFGESDALPATTAASLSRFLRSLLEQLGLQPCVAGFSMGGQVALHLALENPAAARSLVLVNPAGLGTRLRWSLLARAATLLPPFHAACRRLSRRSDAALRTGLKRMISDPESITEDLVAEVRASMRSPGAGEAWASYMQHEFTWSGFRNDLTARLGELKLSCLLIHGERDRLIPAARIRAAARLISRSELCMLRCGHWSPRQRPDQVARAMLEFLEPDRGDS